MLKDSVTPFWDLPGGNLVKNESHIVGLGREIKEETNLDMIHNDKIGSTELALGIGNEPESVTFYKVKVATPEGLKISKEHVSFEWVRPENLNKFNLGAFEDVVEKLYG